ncbi:MAG: methyl-accepting chemotaxis protein [Rhodospirillaceae bacterium]|nr:methyl-accepting chemotaxis protein [Rhodospirillaceae bacterium]
MSNKIIRGEQSLGGRLSAWRRNGSENGASFDADVIPPRSQESGGLNREEGIAMILMARQANLLVEAFEGEIKGTVGTAVDDGESVDQSAKEAIAAVNHVSEQVQIVNEASQATVANVQSVASATEELATTEREMTNLVHRAENLASNAVDKAERASQTVAELAEASRAINGIVVFIEDLARRTNMLALNASIEAQRAGAAGKGFAVVAGEVKDLAKQTASATRDIREKIAGIQKTTGEAGEAIGAITSAVGEIQSINGEVAASVTQQAAATGEISRNAQEASTRVSEVTTSIASIARQAQTAFDLSIGMENKAAGIASRLKDMRRRLESVVSTSQQSKKRMDHIPLSMPARIIHDGQPMDGELLELSPSECCFRPNTPLIRAPERTALELPWLGQLGGSVQAEGSALRIRFDDLPGDTAVMLRKLIESFDVLDLDMVAMADNAARQIKTAFEQGLDRGEITSADLFDEDYKIVPGSNPVQHMTRYIPFADRVLPPIQEPLASSNPRIVAVCAVDRNGFLPVNLLKYSQPQGKDPVWNAANCRNRRLLNDPVGLAAGRNLERFIFQTYIREVGLNNMLVLKDLAMPIHIRGRHWGAIRITYKS